MLLVSLENRFKIRPIFWGFEKFKYVLVYTIVKKRLRTNRIELKESNKRVSDAYKQFIIDFFRVQNAKHVENNRSHYYNNNSRGTKY